jgi:hypothetical protein
VYVQQHRLNMRWLGEFGVTRLVGALSCVLCPVSCIQFSWCRLDNTTHNSRARITRHVDSVVGVLSLVLCLVSGVCR